MAEIKSTLDLVMEKTKHLSLSEEEREAQEVEESKKTIRGILQRYLDRIITKEELLASLNRLREASDIDCDPLFIEETTSRVTLIGSNHRLLELLSADYGIDVSAMESAVKDYGDAARALMKQKRETAKEDLFDNHQVSGTAVLPNMEADPSWVEDSQLLSEQFGKRMAEAKEGILNSFLGERG